MFCKNCGKEIDDSALVCPNCGVATDNMVKATAPVASVQKNTMALVGFILSFFTSFIGLIISIMGLSNSKKPEYNGDGRGLAIAGIIISSIGTAVYVLLISLIVGGTCAALGAM